MRSIFSGNADINKNAYMNWRTSWREASDSMVELAKGFIESALELSQSCVDDNRHKRADILIFPILFNANHGIEVYLKSICWTLNQLLQTNKDFSKHHNLNNLLEDTQNLIERYTDQETARHFLDQTKVYINDVYDKINIPQSDDTQRKPDLTFTRYVLDQKGRPHFYMVEKENVIVDLEHFTTIMQKIYEDLDSMHTYLYYELESTKERMSE